MRSHGSHGRFLNVVDIEATCWEGGGRPPGEEFDIIEVGLTVVDVEERRRVSKHRILVRPERSTVSDFCTELTGLTPGDVDTAPTFADACQRLRREHDSGARVWASWGDYDRKQFTEQCAMTGVRYPFGAQHVNAKRTFSEARGSRKGFGMARALELVGLPLEGRHHRGEDDAWNIAALVLWLMEAEQWPGLAPAA